jgi:hypothetical protein
MERGRKEMRHRRNLANAKIADGRPADEIASYLEATLILGAKIRSGECRIFRQVVSLVFIWEKFAALYPEK